MDGQVGPLGEEARNAADVVEVAVREGDERGAKLLLRAERHDVRRVRPRIDDPAGAVPVPEDDTVRGEGSDRYDFPLHQVSSAFK